MGTASRAAHDILTVTRLTKLYLSILCEKTDEQATSEVVGSGLALGGTSIALTEAFEACNLYSRKRVDPLLFGISISSLAVPIRVEQGRRLGVCILINRYLLFSLIFAVLRNKPITPEKRNKQINKR